MSEEQHQDDFQRDMNAAMEEIQENQPSELQELANRFLKGKTAALIIACDEDGYGHCLPYGGPGKIADMFYRLLTENDSGGAYMIRQVVITFMADLINKLDE